jgi:hypothetical protein
MQARLELAGSDHAWSGGTRGGSHSDARGPNVSKTIRRFVERVRGRYA